MTNEKSWKWLWLRRVGVHAILGALTGAIFGALSVSFAGILIALGLGAGDVFKSGAGSGTLDVLTVCWVAALIGVCFGGIAGSAAGLVSWVTLGVVSRPSPVLWPSRPVFKLTMWSLFLGAMTGVPGYATWCLWHSLRSNRPFMDEFDQRCLEAAFGVSGWMVVAHFAAMLLAAGRTDLGRSRSARKTRGES